VLLENAIEACANDDVPEIRTMADTLSRWREEILNHHRTGASNGPTEGFEFCATQVKRAGRGFTNFDHYKLRVLSTPEESPGFGRSSRHGSPQRVSTEARGACFLKATDLDTLDPPLVLAASEEARWSPPTKIERLSSARRCPKAAARSRSGAEHVFVARGLPVFALRARRG
jgi:Transposase